MLKLFYFLLIFPLSSLSQGTVFERTDSIADNLETYLKTHPVERPYLQFDKPYYAAGDTIYFKAYITTAEKHLLSDLSRVLYVNLLNKNNKIITSLMLHVNNGITWGDFELPDTLNSGTVHIIAFTRLMSETNGYFFNRAIEIINTTDASANNNNPVQKKKTIFPPGVQFLPEGGELIAGIKSKVAFKAIDSDGLGISLTGNIRNGDSKSNLSFKSTRLGMGYFYLTPEKGETYSADVVFADGRRIKLALPAVTNDGIRMSVDNDSLSKANVSIACSHNYFERNKSKLYQLLIYSSGTIISVPFKLDSNLVVLNILKRRLLTGIARLTLFSPENTPISERLIFVQNYGWLTASFNQDKSENRRRGETKLQMQISNRAAEIVKEGHYSLSVIDENKVIEDEDAGRTILTDLLLTDDLKGYVERPNYYFNGSQAALKELDLVMLTHGYRRFEWKDVNTIESKRLPYNNDQGLNLKGRISNFRGNPIAGSTVRLLDNTNGLLATTVSDEKGLFDFHNLTFTDSAQVIITAVDKKGNNNLKITYLPEESKTSYLSAIKFPVLPPEATDSIALINYKKAAKIKHAEDVKYNLGKVNELKQVNIKARKPENEYRTQSFAGAGHADKIMHSDEIEQVQGPLTVSLNGRLSNVVFNGNNPHLAGNSGAMLVVLDGAELDASGLEVLDGLQASDIETVEVLKYASAAAYGMQGANGVLVITTKPRRILNEKDIISKGILTVKLKGFYKAKTFYVPQYDHVLSIGKRSDFRSTIYWNPEIRANADGKLSISYFNADDAAIYRVTIEGIDDNGNLLHQVFRYEITDDK